MKKRVEFRGSATADLDSIDDFIAQDSPERARAFVLSVQERCGKLADFPMAGRKFGHRGSDMRSISFDRRVATIYRVERDAVEIIRVLYGGRDLDAALASLTVD